MQNAFLTPQEEKPLTLCQKCKDQPCIKTKKICDEVEALLVKPRGGRHTKEILTDPAKMENMQSKGTTIRGKIIKGIYKGLEGAVVVSSGKRKYPVHYED